MWAGSGIDPPRSTYFSRGKFLDLRPALERARRAAYTQRVFCERTPTVCEKKSKGKKFFKKINLRSYSTGHAPRPPTAQPDP